MSALAARALEAIGPGMRERAGPLLTPLVEALSAPAQAVDALLTVAPGPLGAAPLTDAASTPYPHWLGQAAGLRVPASLSTAAARAYITARGVSRRGTPGALIAAARSALAGGVGVVRLRERVGGDPYAATVITFAAQTPDSGAVLAAAMTEKPVGLVLTHTVLAGQTWGDVAASGATWGQVATMSVRELREKVPDA